ncbi:cysteinyl-tRNA synthetase [Methylophilus rhizosphaerae]|uniref:Cysteine--tRNA ligase n=1 Tax=Methylophilus rhizosphaerae TaxID=492660 RepID=A0A1G9D2L6_9PROT|nr:cysteine--tRNA ligase [Methylophilus rhizosphaerae]SDK58117.1 cysteinyl-tRNA synthetase [Methylophilus rhizosphaerae]
MLKLYNTLTRSKQDFQPIQPNKVRMYVCGMTVYDFCHLGHARVMVVFDMVARWLRTSGYDVTYVRNITDIDDKIIKRAQENNESIQSLTQRFITAMDEDSAKLGIIRPDLEPRATEHIQGMLDMIGTLVAKGFAYQAGNGDVFYKVRSFSDYGKLSGKSLDDLRAGERVDVDNHKQDPLDFVLWKSAKPGEPYWESPWGNGRPGWHIECSAMSAEQLGEHFDIHGGGQDLQFPHHENEIAQSEATHGCTMANYWMHNGFVRVDDEKMSKSLGNFFTIREVLEKYDPEVVRFFILRAHYRSALNYSDKHLDDAKASLTRLYTALRGVGSPEIAIDWQDPHAAKFQAAMDDDFNTAEALAILFELASELNRDKSPTTAALLKQLAGIVGLLQRDPESFMHGETSAGGLDIEVLIAARIAAKKAKDYAEADRIRQALADAGIVLEDTPQGTTWRRA